MDDARERVDGLGEDLVVGVQVATQADSAVALAFMAMNTSHSVNVCDTSMVLPRHCYAFMTQSCLFG